MLTLLFTTPLFSSINSFLQHSYKPWSFLKIKVIFQRFRHKGPDPGHAIVDPFIIMALVSVKEV